MGRVVVLGASLMDMNLRLDRLPTRGETRLGREFFSMPGGKGANQAVAARRAGGEVVFLTAFGHDDFGRQIRDRYFDEGIDLRHARIVDTDPSGVALILVGDDGENLIGVTMGANARLTPEWVDELPDDVFAPPGVLLASLEVPLEVVRRAIERANRSGMPVILNPAPMSANLWSDRDPPNIDVLTPNQTEAGILTGMNASTDPSIIADALVAMGVGTFVLTLAEEGCLVVEGKTRVKLPAHRVRAVDTVGAGDAFNGALAVALAEGLALVEAATRANAAAAIAVTHPGAQGSLPTRDAIERMMAGRH
ncbi:ribokinase [Tundrisphaera lichenicola]|uniref:ribokinase n=1 Tax=Tundrisphaera lichenicola TaxID=2029860 RepID=UPI003EBADB63